MLKEARCPRCNGPVGFDRDEYGWYEECLMCGYQHDLESIIEIHKHVSEHNPEQREEASIAG